MNRVPFVSLLVRIAAAAGALLAVVPAGAAEPPATLTLEECVRRALVNNFAVEIGRFDTANARESLVVARSSFDPALRLSSTKSGSRSESSGTVSGSLDTRLSATQRLSTGASVTVGTSLNRDTSTVFSGYNPAFNSDLSLSVTQPLLQGAGRTVNRAAIERSRISLDRANLGFRGTMMDVVLDTEIAYYQLYFAGQQLNVRRLSLAAAQRLHEENKIRRDTGVLTDLEVLSAEVSVANQQRNVLLAEQQLHEREDGLRALIGQFELDARVDTVGFPEPSAETVNVATTFARTKAAQPEYISTQAAIEQLRIDSSTAKNARLPALDLSSTMGYNARRSSAGSAFSALPGSDGYNWQVGLALSYPWARRADKARWRQAENNLNSALARLRQTEQSLLVQARTSVRAIETSREALQVAALATTLSEKQYEFEKAKYDAGSSIVRRVLDAQTDLDNARVNELSSKVSLLQSLANLRRLEGRTLESYPTAVPADLRVAPPAAE